MLKKLILLFIIFLIVIPVGAFYIAHHQISRLGFSLSNLTPTPLPLRLQAQSTLSLIDSSTASQKSATVMVTTGSNKVTGIQVELNYDPSTISNITLTPGTFFNSPLVLLKSIDPTKSHISYAIAIQPTEHGKTGSGSVVTITYTPISKEKRTLFTFTPQTVVTADGTVSSVLKKAN